MPYYTTLNQLNPIRVKEKEQLDLPLATEYADYEIIGYDPDIGSIVQWDAAGDTLGIICAYASHETPEDFGLDNLTGIEMARLLLTGWIPR